MLPFLSCPEQACDARRLGTLWELGVKFEGVKAIAVASGAWESGVHATPENAVTGFTSTALLSI